jgi:hypothetical protein
MTVGYLAFVFGPAAAGALAAATSLRAVNASLVLAGVAVTALATRLDISAATCGGLMDRAGEVPLLGGGAGHGPAAIVDVGNEHGAEHVLGVKRH